MLQAEKKLKSLLYKSGPLLAVLTSGLITRIFIFVKVTPRVQTDSLTYLFLSDLTTMRTPGYTVFMEFLHFFNDLFSFTLDYFGLIVFVQVFILGLGNSLLIYLFSKKLTGSRWFSVGVGILYNCNYFILGFEFNLLTELLATSLLLLTLHFYIEIFEGKRYAPYVAGLLSVFLLLTRPVFLVFFIGLLSTTILVHFRKILKGPFLKTHAKGMAIFLILSLVGIGSWCTRNKIKYDYFGISTVMPLQFRHYTKSFFHKYKTGQDEEMDRFVAIYFEEDLNTYNFQTRIEKEFNMTPVEFSRLYMKMNVRMIKDYPWDYIKQIPVSAAYYYRNYSSYWMTPYNRKLLTKNKLISRIFRFFFRINTTLYRTLPTLLMMVLVLPALFLFFLRKRQKEFHFLLLVVMAINYNFVISVLTTNSGIDNLRYRVPVEPLILMVFM
ncbi:MAG: hypothetical protein MUP98_12575, partial [Candidatus Aminicenantes bacterium]|nr:hypothetical protein [Candidatus Aminicenantes bacterium]